jgi:hypothetical protein
MTLKTRLFSHLDMPSPKGEGSKRVSGVAARLTRRLVDPYDAGSLSERMRRRRWQRLLAAFPDLPDMHVLDIGGDVRAWQHSGLRPAHVTLLNPTTQHVEESWMTAVVGDACEPWEHLLKGDLIYSNSVIEHVGGHWRRTRFAESIRRAGDCYWVQTPYRYFPVEPHFLCPGLHYLPKAAQAAVIVHWPIGHYASVRERTDALQGAMDIELLSITEMNAYFSDARIEREKIPPFTKSIVAIKGAACPGRED